MRWFINFLRTQRLIIPISLLLLILLIWVVGSWFGLSADTRFILILVVIVIALVVIVLERARAARGAEQLEKSLKSQADDQVLGVRPEKREEIEQLKQQLAVAIDSLKKSKLSRGRGGRSALYALPWYMMIGPPAAGKTTAIKNSGLDFPFGADREIQGVGGTRNCDWWFSNSAILLDTAGRYTTEEDDREEWIAFLDMLKRNRKRQPINGVLVAISIADVLNANDQELEWHAKNIRKRTDELIQRLEVRFPIYLVFTKCDLISGFVEFFEDMSRVQRQQIWGSTFGRDQKSDTNPRAVFEHEFDRLAATLNKMRLDRLGTSMKRENRRRVYVFPLEFRAMRRPLSRFVGKLFQPNPYQESPIFRGIYFTSGTQEGVPIDRVIAAVAESFGLASDATDQYSPEVETKSYFIRDLFTEIIIPDQNLVGLTSRSNRNRRFLRLGIIAGATLLLGLFILGVTQAYLGSRSTIGSTSEAVESIDKVNLNDSRDLLRDLNRLEILRARVRELESDEAGIFSFGMDRSSELVEPAYRLYFRKLDPFIQRYVKRELENHLRAPESREYARGYLQTYLLIGPERKLLDTTNVSFLRRQINQLVADALPQVVSGEAGRQIVQRHVETFVLGLTKPGFIPPMEVDQNLIKKVRADIYEPPSAQSVYARLKSEANLRLEPVNLSDVRVGLKTVEIPGVFTRSAWETNIEGAITRESAKPGGEDWVLGTKVQQLPPDMQNPEAMAATLKELYFSEYITAWRRLLSSVQYDPSRDLADASNRFRMLTDPVASPLTTLLRNAVEQTTFEEGMSEAAKEKAGGLVQKLGQRIGIGGGGDAARDALGITHPVDRQFVGLHTFMQEKGGQSEYNTLLGQLSQVSVELEKLGGEPSRSSREKAADVVQGRGTIPQAMQVIRQTLMAKDPATREEIRQLFEGPVRFAWTAMAGDAQSYLNAQWQARVCEPFNSTLGRYFPFNKDARDDASAADIASYFQSQSGTFWAFYEEELKDLIRRDSWQPFLWEGSGIAVSERTRRTFQQANTIAKSIAGSGGASFDFEMQAQLPSQDGIRIDKICLTIDGENECYQMGRPRYVPFTVPGRQGPSGATLEIYERGSLLESKQGSGDWGWLRLLNQARITPRTPREYAVEWTFRGESRYRVVVKYSLQAKSANNPFAPGFFDFDCPRQLN